MTKKRQASLTLIVGLAVFAVVIYWGVAAAAFEWRNPKANRMTVIREFRSVLSWQRMDRYQ